MGVDWYTCAECNEPYCSDADEHTTCEVCMKSYHDECFDGQEICRLCPCNCGGATDEEKDILNHPPGTRQDYGRQQLYDDECACEDCECTSHRCESVKCCGNCREKFTKGPSDEDVKEYLIRSMSVEELVKALGKNLEEVKKDMMENALGLENAPKFLPYPTRECDSCHATLQFDKVGGFCDGCQNYLCIQCWPADAIQCNSCSPNHSRKRPRRFVENEDAGSDTAKNDIYVGSTKDE